MGSLIITIFLLLIIPLEASAREVGCIKGDCLNGKGQFNFSAGDSYSGEWKDDKMHGQGTYTFADGRKYVGELEDDKLCGPLTFAPPEIRRTASPCGRAPGVR